MTDPVPRVVASDVATILEAVCGLAAYNREAMKVAASAGRGTTAVAAE